MNAAGDPPDLLRVYGSSVPLLAVRKLLLDLTPYFKTSQYLKLDDLSPVADLYKFDGKRQGKGPIYGMPKDWSPDMTIFYNKKMLDAAGIQYPSATVPMTYAQFAEMQKKLTKREGDRVLSTAAVPSRSATAGPSSTSSSCAPATAPPSTVSDFKRINLVKNPEVEEGSQFLPRPGQGPRHPQSGRSPVRLGRRSLCRRQDRGAAVRLLVRRHGGERPDQGNVGMAPAPVWGKKRLSPCITATGYVSPRRANTRKKPGGLSSGTWAAVRARPGRERLGRADAQIVLQFDAPGHALPRRPTMIRAGRVEVCDCSAEQPLSRPQRGRRILHQALGKHPQRQRNPGRGP